MADRVTIILENKLEIIYDLLENNDFKQARHLIKKVNKKYPRHYLVSYVKGMYAGFVGDYPAATDSFRQSISTYSKYALAHYNLAINYQKMNRLDLSVKHHKMALACATEEELGVIGASKKMIEIFEDNLPEGLSLQAYFDDAEQFEKAFELMHGKKFDKALIKFKSIIENQPQHVQSYGNSGICLMHLNDFESSRQYLQKALDIDPDYEPAISNLAILRDLESGALIELPEMTTRYFYAEKVSHKND